VVRRDAQRERGTNGSTLRASMRWGGSLAAAWTLGCMLVAPGRALADPLPQYSEDKHLGVRECAGGPCHGSATAVGERIKENEHTIWLRRDRHAEAYKTLLTERSRSIAKNYGLDKPPSESEVCLDCHSDNAANRVADFRVEDGVGCESCHGGSERWLKTHTSSTRAHKDNVELGMYPTDDPVKRAELCLSCHFGTGKKFVRHRMLGAGHPRLRFELDSYQVTQPAHFTVDDDYIERGKVVTEPVKLWAIGQAVQVRELLRALADPQRNQDGIWPEFSVLDCYTCHHSMEEKRRPSGRARGLGTDPGTPRLNDAGFLMLRHILVGVHPESSASMREGILKIHAAVSKSEGNRREIARDLAAFVDREVERIRQWDVGPRSLQKIALSLIEEGLDDQYYDYPSAEQAATAVQSLADTLNSIEPFSDSKLDRLNSCIDALLRATQDGDRFQLRSPEFVTALRCAKGELLNDSAAE
jgi:hypothetical protein